MSSKKNSSNQQQAQEQQYQDYGAYDQSAADYYQYYQNYEGAYDYSQYDASAYPADYSAQDYYQYYQNYPYAAEDTTTAPRAAGISANDVIPAVPQGYDQGSYVPPELQAKAIREKKKKATVVRKAANQTWEDSTLLEWDPNDHRVFCGDLGNEVNDDMLSKAFSKYPSFQKAKVIFDKRSGKSKGYGFVSFGNVGDFVKAVKEMNGKYIGNRPCKLRKSTWQDRNAGGGGKKRK